MYINLSSTTKLHRATQIVNDIGSNGYMKFYAGPIPASPTISASGILLVSLPLSATPAIVSLALSSAFIVSPGIGGTGGVYVLGITGGGGTGAAGNYTVTGSVLSSITITNNGSGFTSLPTLGGFGTAGISGAIVSPIMTATVVFNPIATTTAIATGTAGFVRVTTSSGVPIIDLDVGTTNAFSVVMENLYIAGGTPVSCTANVLLEA